jgi:hypothetical protein
MTAKFKRKETFGPFFIGGSSDPKIVEALDSFDQNMNIAKAMYE